MNIPIKLVKYVVKATERRAVSQAMLVMCKCVNMKNLFECANQYVKESDWKELALVKVCLCAIGIMIGMAIPKNKKNCCFLIAGLVFVGTYVPLMAKFVKIVMRKK